MTPLKLPLPKIVMVSALRDLTKNITSLKAIGNPFLDVGKIFIRNLRGLIKSPNSLERKILKPHQKLLSITKKPFVIDVV